MIFHFAIKGLFLFPFLFATWQSFATPLPDLLQEVHYRTSDCEALETITRIEPIEAVLSPVARLYALPCTNSSHDDATWRVYLFETGEIGGIRPLLFSHYSPDLGWVGTDILRNVELDAKSATITHKTLSRWGGACGSYGKWQWNDFTLKLLEYRIRRACDKGISVESWHKIYPTTK